MMFPEELYKRCAFLWERHFGTRDVSCNNLNMETKPNSDFTLV